MNQDNLENLKKELKALGFDKKLLPKMEEAMKKDLPDFRLHDRMPATRGQVELKLHFKQSTKSDYYFFNKFDVAHNPATALEKDQKYLIITPGENGKSMVKSIDNLAEAVRFFKDQTGNSELAIGKDAANKVTVAQMETGKVSHVDKDFQRSFYAQAAMQTFFVKDGKGFNAEQGANLIQGRAVYRDDLLSTAGATYKAWIKLDFDTPKENAQNFKTNQYHDPKYDFDLAKVLDQFKLKELADPASRQKLEDSLRNGNRPMVTAEKDGQPMRLAIEAVPRYRQLNVFNENGRSEKREQFLRETETVKTITRGKVQDQSVGQRL